MSTGGRVDSEKTLHRKDHLVLLDKFFVLVERERRERE
jgi:hypothetical protein